jgi:hypothetical protein
MEGVRIYEDAELNTALSKSNTPSSPDAIKKVILYQLLTTCSGPPVTSEVR